MQHFKKSLSTTPLLPLITLRIHRFNHYFVQFLQHKIKKNQSLKEETRYSWKNQNKIDSTFQVAKWESKNNSFGTWWSKIYKGPPGTNRRRQLLGMAELHLPIVGPRDTERSMLQRKGWVYIWCELFKGPLDKWLYGAW